MKKILALTALVVLLPSLWAMSNANSTGAWTIDAGDPKRDGKAGFEITIEYTDPVTFQKLEKVIEVEIANVLKTWTASQKATAIADRLMGSLELIH